MRTNKQMKKRVVGLFNHYLIPSRFVITSDIHNNVGIDEKYWRELFPLSINADIFSELFVGSFDRPLEISEEFLRFLART